MQSVGLMGFGRIGRNVFRQLDKVDGIEVGAIVDINAPDALAYLLKYDSIYGRFDKPVELDGTTLIVGDRRIPIISAREPGDVDWSAHGVGPVVQATGKYRTMEWCLKHLDSGASRVLLASTPEDPGDIPVLLKGINDDILSSDTRVVAMGSNTSNAFAPLLTILDDAFGIERSFFTIVHAFTNNQRLADVPTEGFRTSRAAGENIIPADTNSADIISRVLPQFAGKLASSALNVPVENGSTVDAVTEFSTTVTAEDINAAVEDASKGRFAGIIEYTDDPIVSSDVRGASASGVFDSLATLVIDETMAKTIIWFDNGWGYSARIVETLALLGEMGVHA
jgi:glyceraldehyde 3-phosphate dehydrogenase